MASVGSLAVQLVANSDGLSKGIKAAEKRLTAFAQTATGGGLFKTVTAGLGGAGNVVDNVFGPLKGLLGTIPLVGGALASFPTSVGGFAEWFRQGSEAILETDKVAKKLGVDVSEVSPILAVAGGASEGMARSLLKLQTKLQGLTEEDKTAEAAFGRLGLSLESFRGTTVTQQLGLIADKINALPSPTQRAAAAFNLFGKTGYEILPLLSRGSEGLKAAADKMKGLGFGVDATDVEQVRAANKALKSIDQTFSGIKRQLAIGLAPLISALGNQFESAAGFAEAFGDKVTTALETSARILALYTGGPQASIDLANAFSNIHADIAAKKIEAQVEKEIGRAFSKADMLKNASGFFGPALNQFADDAAKKAEGMAERFRKKFGRDPRSVSGQANGALFDMFERSQKVIQENESPLEKFTKRFRDLQKMTESGALDFDNYAIAVSKAVAELDKANKIELPAAFYQGSSQAISAVNRATVAASTGSAEDRITQLLKQAKEQAEKQTQAARDTTKAVQQIFKRGI